MDVWVDKCNRTIVCEYCGEEIVNGETEIFGRHWQRQTKGGKLERWVKTFHWHARRSKDSQCCWLEQSIKNLTLHPFVETRGRKELTLTQEQKAIRLKLLQKRARIVQVLVEETGKPVHMQSVDRVIRLGSQLESLKTQIEPVGGVPKSW